MHYIEYLSLSIRRNRIETIEILQEDDLETVVRRAGKKLPPHGYATPKNMYRYRLKQVELPPTNLITANYKLTNLWRFHLLTAFCFGVWQAALHRVLSGLDIQTQTGPNFDPGPG